MLKLERLIHIRSLALKKEGSSASVLISDPYNEKGKGPLKPFKVFYYKEKDEDLENKI